MMRKRTAVVNENFCPAWGKGKGDGRGLISQFTAPYDFQKI